MEATLTGRARSFFLNFSKIHDFQTVDKNHRGKFVQKHQILQSVAYRLPPENGDLWQFLQNCHKKRAIFGWTPTFHFGVKEVVTFLYIILEWWEKEVKTVFDWAKHLKFRSKTLKMRYFSCRFELFSYLCNRFTTHLVLYFIGYLLGIKKLKFHSIKQSLIGVFGRRWLGCRSWQQASKSRHNAPTILYFPIDINRYYISLKVISWNVWAICAGAWMAFSYPYVKN